MLKVVGFITKVYTVKTTEGNSHSMQPAQTKNMYSVLLLIYRSVY